MIPTDTIDKLEQTWRSISALGVGLTEAQWKLPTDLPAWTVQDNLAHLVGTERTLQGLPGTAHRATVTDHVRNPIGAANEHEVDSRRHLPGAEVLREWDDLVELRLTTLRSAGDDYFDQPAITPTGPGTLADFLHIRVLDCWLHEQDMRRAVGLPGHLSGPAAEHTVDRLIRTIPIVVGKRAATPEGGAVVIDITGGVHRHVVCEVQGGRAALIAEPSAPPLAVITLDTEAFVVLATGRRPASAVASRAVVMGDADLAGRVLDQLNMMI
jgi:uncharacterized protein (TIGR03083 family)